jgi:UDP-N-acetylmuramoyl-tripeptide--D-alanyl-D-alanine ligase
VSNTGGAQLELTLRRIAEVVSGEAMIPAARAIHSVSIDSRTLQRDALFVPLPGARVDGHRFLDQALERGAAGLLVRKSFQEALSPSLAGAARRSGAGVVLVEDTLSALQRLGRWYLEEQSPAVRIGVTGSTGKTTTKEILAACLSREAPTAASRGNLNSEIGLPLSCFDVTSGHRYAVFEMGINQPGEMDILADIVRPDLVVVTNIGTAHIGLLGSREIIAREKIKIAKHFDGRQTAFLYEGDDFYELMAGLTAGKVVPFGPRSTRGYEGSDDLGLDGTIVHWEGLRIGFPLFGFHNLLDALAALSVSAELGISKSKIKEGLEAVKPLFGRSQIFRGPITVLQDSYNANPESVGQLFEFLTALAWRGRKLVVLGSMKELGADTEKAHRAAGRLALEAGVDRILLFGEEMRWAYEEIRTPAHEALTFWTTEFDELAGRLKSLVTEGDLVVLKGSRAMELERLLEVLPVEHGRPSGVGV